MSWKYLLFSLLVISVATINADNSQGSDNSYPSDEIKLAHTPNLTKSHKSGNLLVSDVDGAVQQPKNKKKKRVVTKRYVKRCDLKKDSVLESSSSSTSQSGSGTSENHQGSQFELKTVESSENPESEEEGKKVDSSDTEMKSESNQNEKIRKRVRVKKYVKKYSARQTQLQQLEIEYPTNNITLTANTTSTVFVTSTPISKSYKQFKVTNNGVLAVVVYNCTSGIFNVTTPLDTNTTYTVNPDMSGVCSVFATVLNNPEFLNSQIITLSSNTPIYVNGLSDGSFYTTETVQISARASNGAVVPLKIVVMCGLVSRSIELPTNDEPRTLNLDAPELTGNCTAIFETIAPFFSPPDPTEITINPAILFLRPAPNTVYQAGADILVNLVVTNRNTDLNVTVELYCNEVFVKSLTQNVRSTYIFTQDNQVFGSCVLSLAEVDGYYDEKTVSITVLQALSFASPIANELIRPGTNYNILVNGNAPNGSVPILVTGRCPVGGEFTQSVLIGVTKSVLMGTRYMGFCTLVATADNFSSSTVPVLVFSPLTPQQIADEARLLMLNGIIIEKTECFNCNTN
jgi:hypothetical protein